MVVASFHPLRTWCSTNLLRRFTAGLVRVLRLSVALELINSSGVQSNLIRRAPCWARMSVAVLLSS